MTHFKHAQLIVVIGCLVSSTEALAKEVMATPPAIVEKVKLLIGN